VTLCSRLRAISASRSLTDHRDQNSARMTNLLWMKRGLFENVSAVTRHCEEKTSGMCTLRDDDTDELWSPQGNVSEEKWERSILRRMT